VVPIAPSCGQCFATWHKGAGDVAEVRLEPHLRVADLWGMLKNIRKRTRYVNQKKTFEVDVFCYDHSSARKAFRNTNCVSVELRPANKMRNKPLRKIHSEMRPKARKGAKQTRAQFLAAHSSFATYAQT
jgi:hypothetical protein